MMVMAVICFFLWQRSGEELVNIVLHVLLSKKMANGCDYVRVLIEYRM